MKKLPTVKIGGKTAFVIDRTHIEDDIAAAEAISRDAARFRWLREHWDDQAVPLDIFPKVPFQILEKMIDERI